MQIEAGKYYITRDGRKVGPATMTTQQWSIDDGFKWSLGAPFLYRDDGTNRGIEGGYVVAEWTAHETLLPCPFCGCEVTMSDLYDEDDRRMWVREIECDICQLTMRDWTGWPGRNMTFNRGQMSADVGHSLAKMWNTRAALEPKP